MMKMSESNNSKLLTNILEIYVDGHSSSKFYYNFIGSEYYTSHAKEIKTLNLLYIPHTKREFSTQEYKTKNLKTLNLLRDPPIKIFKYYLQNSC